MLLYTDYVLDNSNTFHIQAKSDFYVEIGTLADLDGIIKKRKYSELPRLILGNGSNILFTKNFKGLVLKNSLKGISTVTENDSEVIIKVASGENFDDFAAYCAKNRYIGTEYLSGIPGSMGGAAVQNIGAYGQELKNLIEEVEFYNFDTYEVNKLSGTDCKFGYRDSIFKNELADKAFVLSVTLKLAKCKHYEPNLSYGNLQEKLSDQAILSPMIVRRAIIAIRDEKIPNPKQFGNAGSFFKNPEITAAAAKKLKDQHPEIKLFDLENGKFKVPAGQLIDLCGFKDTPDNNVGVAGTNALIVINLGNASGKDIVSFSKKIQSSVKDKFGIKIEPEVVFA